MAWPLIHPSPESRNWICSSDAARSALQRLGPGCAAVFARQQNTVERRARGVEISGDEQFLPGRFDRRQLQENGARLFR